MVGLCASVYLQANPNWATQHPHWVEAVYVFTAIALLFTAFQFRWAQRILGVRPAGDEKASPTPANLRAKDSFNPTANATGGTANIVQNLQVKADEVADLVLKGLKEEVGEIRPGDGFVQLEDDKFEMQVPSIPLQPGQTFSLKYFYANRGALPVYDVQTWGIMHILILEANPTEHLKQVMLDGAKKGHEKFPDKGATLGVGIVHHSFATLTEPLTEKQIDAVRQGVCALILMVGGVWKDTRNTFHYWAEGRKAELPDFPDLTNQRWKGF